LIRTFRKPSDLPSEIAVFPLSGAVLFPGADLPLNIFEPRYLNMVDDALSGERLIGMIQPALGASTPSGFSSVGCIGRLTRFQETDDGRYLIVLTGICRFHVLRETTASTPYRTVAADVTRFAGDLRPEGGSIDRARLLAALRGYIERYGASADWEAIKDAPDAGLVHALAAGCPFSPLEKQALLEAETLEERCSALIALLIMDRDSDGAGYLQ
jgi:hypothetical protein